MTERAEVGRLKIEFITQIPPLPAGKGCLYTANLKRNLQHECGRGRVRGCSKSGRFAAGSGPVHGCTPCTGYHSALIGAVRPALLSIALESFSLSRANPYTARSLKAKTYSSQKSRSLRGGGEPLPHERGWHHARHPHASADGISVNDLRYNPPQKRS